MYSIVFYCIPGRFAESIPHQRTIGTIEQGKEADLVLLRGNPLSDITNTRLRAGVMVRGRWFDLAAIRAMVDAVAATNARDEEFLRIVHQRGIKAALQYAKTHRIAEDTLNEFEYQLLKLSRRWREVRTRK